MIAPTCAPGVRQENGQFSGRGTRPLREDGRLYGFAGGAAGEWVDGQEFVRREMGDCGETGDHAVF